MMGRSMAVAVILEPFVMAIFLIIFLFQYGMEEGRKAKAESVEEPQ
ncbi:MAG: hypothetical protein ABI687_08875 [Flavitalea sp.]